MVRPPYSADRPGARGRSGRSVGGSVGCRDKNDDNESNERSSVSDSLIASGFCRHTTGSKWGRLPSAPQTSCVISTAGDHQRPAYTIAAAAAVRMSYGGRSSPCPQNGDDPRTVSIRRPVTTMVVMSRLNMTTARRVLLSPGHAVKSKACRHNA